MANGQAEPRTTILACRRTIGLGKRLEDEALFLGGDADARITYRTVQGHGRLVCRRRGCCRELLGLVAHHFDHHFALRGKLESIAYEIHQELAPSHGIANEEVRDIGVHIVE